MTKLDISQMEIVNGGGCSSSANKAIATIGMIATVGSCFGPIGLFICGPTAIGIGIAGLICAFGE